MERSTETMTAPPIGVMARHDWLRLYGEHREVERYRELMAAIERYEQAGLPISGLWEIERAYLEAILWSEEPQA